MSTELTIVILPPEESSLKATDERQDPNGKFYDPNMAYHTHFWSYYLTWFSLWSHFVIMHYALDNWLGMSRLGIAYTVQYCVLHGYCWAIPDRRYSHWVQQNAKVFYGLATLNLLAYVAGILGGISIYYAHSHGLVQIFGLSMATFQLLTCTPMVAVVIKALSLLFTA